MSIRNLFENNGSVISKKSLSDFTSTYLIESEGVLSSSYLKDNFLPPNIDFSNPRNFAKYGSARKYYEISIKRIINSYPYDGSKKQKLNWRNNSSYLDLFLFDNEYPRYSGSIDIGQSFGTIINGGGGVYTTPSRVEYIFVPKGLQTGSIYNEDEDRTSAFSFNPRSGFCFEFFMKKNGDPSPGNPNTIFHFRNSPEYGDTGHFSLLSYVSSNNLVVRISNESNNGVYTVNSVIDSNWNHYCINIYTSSVTEPKIDIWVNGVKKLSEELGVYIYPENDYDLSFSGSIGASLDHTLGLSNGSNKISGSFDEFRFWRRKREDREIVTNWFSNVDGGYDNDELLNPDMGFYYKFNETTTETGSIDAMVLDYSGRKNHGTWIGFRSGSRTYNSAIENEQKDPNLHFSSSDVYSFYDQKLQTGSYYDVNNNGALINSFPGFILDEDSDEHFQNLCQIMASIFDTLWLQIQSLSNLKNSSYFISGSLPSSILLKLLNSNGLNFNDILSDYSIKELIEDKNDQFNFEKNIENIKQIIYKNIYNNIVSIYKSKGTEKSIRSVFRAFGVDDDVLKIKTYTKEGKIEIDGTKRLDTVRRKNLLDLYGKTDPQNMNGTVYLQYCPDIENAINHISNEAMAEENYLNDKTFELNVLFPVKYDFMNKNHVFLDQQNLSSSLFGFVQIDNNLSVDSTDSTWEADPYKLNIFCVQKDRYTKDAKFVFILTGSNHNQIYTETSWIENVYDNTKWTLAVKFKDANRYSTDNSGIYTTSFDIIGINEESGRILNSFSSSHDLYYTGALTNNNFLKKKTKPYIGALRTNFTGSVLYPAQAKFYSFRVWKKYLSDQNIIEHSYDVHNFGIKDSAENAYNISNAVNNSNIDGEFIPNHETLLINWDFENDLESDSNGIFTASSFRSSSYYQPDSEPLRTVQYNYPGVGYGFNSSSVVIEKGHAIEQKNKIPTDYYYYDSISLQDDAELYFGRQVRPMEYFFTVENSIYSVISEDILNMFSTIDEFNTLFGMTHERFRVEYKSLRLFRHLFFTKAKNSKIDIEKYFSYYKWLDSAIEQIIYNLFPLSANSDSNVRNVIESHVLERPKHYWVPEIIRTPGKRRPMQFRVTSPLYSKRLYDEN